MPILAAPLRALLGCFDFVIGRLSVGRLSMARLGVKQKVLLQDVTPFAAEAAAITNFNLRVRAFNKRCAPLRVDPLIGAVR